MGEALIATSDTSGKPHRTRVVAAATTNITPVKASPGVVHGWCLYNTAAYDVFLKFYDKASAPVLASDVPAFTVKVKAGDKDEYESDIGIPFTAGIAYAITKLIADNDATVLVANDVTGFMLQL
jgi:hypothetical protein